MTNKEKGFTLIELLVVIVIISVLSVITVSVINQNRQRGRAKDAVNKANLEKVVSAIDSYYYLDGKYPIDGNGDKNPLEAVNTSLDQYLQVWPSGFIYKYDLQINEYAVLVEKNLDAGYFKYISSKNEILECPKTDEVLNQVAYSTGCVSAGSY